MNKTQLARRQRIMPGGAPRYIKCYDDHGDADRYTVAFTGRGAGQYWDHNARAYTHQCLAMDASPFHPLGIGQHSTCVLGAHLGTRIHFKDLPPDCRKLVIRDYKEIWKL